jgi:hypothetical protein
VNLGVATRVEPKLASIDRYRHAAHHIADRVPQPFGPGDDP